jgi:hypothetical protein
MKLPIPQKDNEGLHLKVDVFEERGSLDLARLRVFLRVLLLPELLQELYHLTHIELFASLKRVCI